MAPDEDPSMSSFAHLSALSSPPLVLAGRPAAGALTVGPRLRAIWDVATAGSATRSGRAAVPCLGMALVGSAVLWTGIASVVGIGSLLLA